VVTCYRLDRFDTVNWVTGMHSVRAPTIHRHSPFKQMKAENQAATGSNPNSTRKW